VLGLPPNSALISSSTTAPEGAQVHTATSNALCRKRTNSTAKGRRRRDASPGLRNAVQQHPVQIQDEQVTLGVGFSGSRWWAAAAAARSY
jgi:hypothetical protein